MNFSTSPPPLLQLSEALGPIDDSTKHADSSAMELLLLLQRLLLGIIYSHSPPDNEHKDSKYKLTLGRHLTDQYSVTSVDCDFL